MSEKELTQENYPFIIGQLAYFAGLDESQNVYGPDICEDADCQAWHKGWIHGQNRHAAHVATVAEATIVGDGDGEPVGIIEVRP